MSKINEISVEIYSSNAKKVDNDLKKIDKILGTNISGSFLDNLDDEMAEYTQEFTRVLRNEPHVRTGALRDSIDFEKISKLKYVSGVNSGRLIADARNIGRIDYSIPYHNGHGGYRIRPRKAKVLHWIGENGEDIFRAYADIPPSKGDKFVKRAVDNRPKL